MQTDFGFDEIEKTVEMIFPELTIKETKAPDGYEKAEDMQISLSENSEENVFTIVNIKKHVLPSTTSDVLFSKKAFGGEEVEGAEMKLMAEDGTLIEEWTSKKEDHVINLKPGVYQLEEKTAPEGLKRVTTIMKFKVNEDGTVEVTEGVTDQSEGTLELTDKPVDKVVISKVDAATEKELPGAKLQITNEEGTLVEEWISAEKPHEVVLKDGSYTLTEITAPDGYEVAESIKFTVKNGAVDGGKIVMKDAPIKKQDTIAISKVDASTSKELPGATLQIHKDKKLVEEWVSTDKPHEMVLEDGTYTLTEITAPKGYEIAKTITFAVKNGKVAGDKVVMKDKPITIPEIVISKVDATTEKELPGATLQVHDKDGKLIEEWVSKDTPHKIALKDGKYTLTEITAPAGYLIAEKITFTVKDGKVSGDKVVMKDKPIVKLTPKEPEKHIRDATTTKLNVQNEVVETTKEAKIQTNEEKIVLTPSQTVISKRTGDSSNLPLFFVILLLSIGGALIYAKRQN